jgi:hypothetical protein
MARRLCRASTPNRFAASRGRPHPTPLSREVHQYLMNCSAVNETRGAIIAPSRERTVDESTTSKAILMRAARSKPQCVIN